MIGYRRSLNISRVEIVHNGERGRFFCFSYSHDYYTTFFLVLKKSKNGLAYSGRPLFSHPCSARKEEKNVNLQALPFNSKRNENK
jgi:hypothetical protein